MISNQITETVSCETVLEEEVLIHDLDNNTLSHVEIDLSEL